MSTKVRNCGGKKSGLYVWKKYEYLPPYLSFIGNEEFTLKTKNTTANWDGILEYSIDTSTWNVWDGTEISSAGNKLYLRGTGNTVITGNSDFNRFVFTGTDYLKISCVGNIESLLDCIKVRDGIHPTMSMYCYNSMFNGCNSLTTPPELPATKLSAYCYESMFRGCTSLTTAPELPAIRSAMYCCRSMFNGCSSLTTLPKLPITNLSGYCYTNMFSGCSLIKLSTIKTGEYQTEYRIPTTGDGVTNTSALNNMFSSTGGTFVGTPEINTIYYTSNEVV